MTTVRDQILSNGRDDEHNGSKAVTDNDYNKKKINILDLSVGVGVLLQTRVGVSEQELRYFPIR